MYAWWHIPQLSVKAVPFKTPLQSVKLHEEFQYGLIGLFGSTTISPPSKGKLVVSSTKLTACVIVL